MICICIIIRYPGAWQWLSIWQKKETAARNSNRFDRCVALLTLRSGVIRRQVGVKLLGLHFSCFCRTIHIYWFNLLADTEDIPESSMYAEAIRLEIDRRNSNTLTLSLPTFSKSALRCWQLDHYILRFTGNLVKLNIYEAHNADFRWDSCLTLICIVCKGL